MHHKLRQTIVGINSERSGGGVSRSFIGAEGGIAITSPQDPDIATYRDGDRHASRRNEGTSLVKDGDIDDREISPVSGNRCPVGIYLQSGRRARCPDNLFHDFLSTLVPDGLDDTWLVNGFPLKMSKPWHLLSPEILPVHL